jgi:branched-chain amino acid transport system substrate-binding protein
LRSARIVAACALALATCLLPLAGRAADPYVVNVLLPETGAGAFVAKVEVNALTVAEQVINKAGGVRGRPIKFDVLDDQSDPSVAVQLYNKVVASGAPFFLGSSLSATCNATAALLKDGPLQYCFSPGIRPAPGSYVYSCGVDATSLLGAGLHYLRERGLTRIAVITSTDATGQDADRAIDALIAAPENHTLTIVDREHFNPADVNVAAQMARFKASGANVVIGWATGAPFGTILRGVRDEGLDVPVMSTPGNMLAVQLRQYTSIMPRELLFPNLRSFLQPDQMPSGPAKAALVRYYDAFKAAGLQPSGEGQVWDQIMIMVSAVQKLGFGVTATQVRDYVNNLQGWTGINGLYNYHTYPQRGIGIDSLVVLRWDPAKEIGIPLSQPGGALLK